jgi:Tol biopolymer transport system component
LSENDGGFGLAWLNDREIVFARETDVPSVWMMNADGSGARRLTEGSISLNPIASGDGRTVLFDSDRETPNTPEVYRLTLPDGRVTRVTRENGAYYGVPSRDGRTVFYRTMGESPAKILAIASDGGPTTTIFEAPETYGHALSLDGAQLAVVANAGVGTPRTISLVPAGGGAARIIFTTGAALTDVRWYPSGDALLLLMLENRQTNLFRLSLADGAARPLTRFTRGMIGSPAISPDGRRIAYYRGTEESDIVLVKPAQ